MEGESSEPARKAAAGRTPISSLDLKQVSQYFHLQSRESRNEEDARIKRLEKAEDHERRKELLILATVLIGLAVIGASCLFVALRPGPSEDKKWAMAVLASIDSFGIGHASREAPKGGRD